jgi:hypothetical protein
MSRKKFLGKSSGTDGIGRFMPVLDAGPDSGF